MSESDVACETCGAWIEWSAGEPVLCASCRAKANAEVFVAVTAADADASGRLSLLADGTILAPAPTRITLSPCDERPIRVTLDGPERGLARVIVARYNGYTEAISAMLRADRRVQALEAEVAALRAQIAKTSGAS